MTSFAPATAQDVLSAVRWAVSEEAPFEIVGHGSKRGIGRPVQTEHALGEALHPDEAEGELGVSSS